MYDLFIVLALHTCVCVCMGYVSIHEYDVLFVIFCHAEEEKMCNTKKGVAIVP